MTSAIVTALVLDVLLLALVRIVQLFAGGGPRLAGAGIERGPALRRNARFDQAALALSLLAGVLILAWLALA